MQKIYQIFEAMIVLLIDNLDLSNIFEINNPLLLRRILNIDFKLIARLAKLRNVDFRAVQIQPPVQKTCL